MDHKSYINYCHTKLIWYLSGASIADSMGQIKSSQAEFIVTCICTVWCTNVLLCQIMQCVVCASSRTQGCVYKIKRAWVCVRSHVLVCMCIIMHVCECVQVCDVREIMQNFVCARGRKRLYTYVWDHAYRCIFKVTFAYVYTKHWQWYWTQQNGKTCQH